MLVLRTNYSKMLGSILFSPFAIYWPFWIQKTERFRSCSGPRFRHPWGITPKISENHPGILVMLHAKFHTHHWSPQWRNCIIDHFL